jgi:EVE domain
MSKNWIAVASAEHVRLGRAQGFMQVGHGKGAPLKRISPGDFVAYYSPTIIYGEKEPCRAFTAFGRVKSGAPYQGDMGGGFMPWRRDVEWLGNREALIALLLEKMDFTRGQKNWGYKFRFGLFDVSDHDMALIAEATAARV